MEQFCLIHFSFVIKHCSQGGLRLGGFPFCVRTYMYIHVQYIHGSSLLHTYSVLMYVHNISCLST